jgi:hypothetical protein
MPVSPVLLERLVINLIAAFLLGLVGLISLHSASRQFQTFGGSCGSTNLHHPQVISCASRGQWNAGDYHD